MYVTRKPWEILFHHVLVRVLLHMHCQMHLCRQCISYLGLGCAVWVPVLLPLLTLSMLHVTIVAISHLVEKVPSLELLHATEFSVRLV